MAKQGRGVPARLGIVLLNIIAPGLGLLRLGRWPVALAAFGASLSGLLFLNFGPPAPFAILVLVLAITLTSLTIAMACSWRLSRIFDAPRPWHTRWYTVLGTACLAIVINAALTDPDRLRYRSFYLPSEAMAPTLPKLDRLIAYMVSVRPFTRGDLVLVRTKTGSIYIKRVVAIPGDRFAMKDGRIFLNGIEVRQRLVRVEKVQGPFETENARRLAEQLPGERSPHEIYDTGPTAEDNVAEMSVPAGRVMLLGDNRDLSADSRVSVELGGLGGAVTAADLVGRPLYQSWGSSRPLGAKLAN